MNVTAKRKTAGEECLLDYTQEEEEPARIPVTNNFSAKNKNLHKKSLKPDEKRRQHLQAHQRLIEKPPVGYIPST